MPEQLTLDLPVRTSRDRGDFFVSDANTLAVARLDTPEAWPNRKLALIGPEGAGKSHLATAWAEKHGASFYARSDLPDLPVADVDTPCAVETDASQDWAPREEEALFHLHNHLAAHDLPLLLVSRIPPARWPLHLPDLKSRMQATDVAAISAPDDALLSAVLVKLFTDRQVQVPPSLIAWLVPRMHRSFAEAQRIVAELDETALSEGRPITQSLARRVLDNRGSDAH